MSGNEITTSPAGRLADAARQAKARGRPPVHLWNPPLSGDMDICIARDGTWYHEGTPIRREGLVRLFASILKREGEAYFLVTPVEKWRITVEDAPFVAVDVEASGEGRTQQLTFETSVGDRVTAGPDHPLRFAHHPRSGPRSAPRSAPRSGARRPYVTVRDGLEALIDRKSFYRLAELGQERAGWFGVWSGGVFFGMIPLEEMRREMPEE